MSSASTPAVRVATNAGARVVGSSVHRRTVQTVQVGVKRYGRCRRANSGSAGRQVQAVQCRQAGRQCGEAQAREQVCRQESSEE